LQAHVERELDRVVSAAQDIVEPALEASNGLMPVPTGPGTGVTVRPDVLGRFTTGVTELRA